MTVNSRHLLVLNTCPGSITAKTIANELVTEKLAACVQILPGVHAVFRWAGKVDSGDEHLLLIKTTAARYQEVEARIRSLHPYELPEIIAVPITAGFDEYLSWIDKNTRPEPD